MTMTYTSPTAFVAIEQTHFVLTKNEAQRIASNKIPSFQPAAY